MTFRPVFFVVGLFWILLAVLMLIPALHALIFQTGAIGSFLLSATLAAAMGIPVCITCKRSEFNLMPRQIFLLTNCAWFSLSCLAALPFYLQLKMSFTDAFFETMSGITTTGSTVLEGLDQLNKSILLWRSLLQWLGGIGFIVMAVAILPFLKVGGMRLFQSESSDWSEKALPRSGNIAKRIVLIYILLTFTCAYLYFLGGMNGFQAINHAMTTLSTGGYSTSDSSMAHFNNPFIHWIATLFMILGALPFTLFVKMLLGDSRSLTCDSQVRAFVGFLLVLWLLFTLWLWAVSDRTFFQALTLIAFNTTSVITTTGFALTDYTLWGGFAATLFLCLTVVGGCSGSTAGGIKIFRFQIGARLLGNQLGQLAHPKACFVQSYNGQPISVEILSSLIAFGFFYALLTIVIALLLSLMGLDTLTSFSGAATAIANVGPGLGEIIGPAGNFATLPDSAKWLLGIGMLMGRLEVITVLVLFTPAFWRG